MRPIEMTGLRYGRLLVIGNAGKTAHRQMLWACRCDCGGQSVVAGGDLRRGKITSCGCQRIERSIEVNTKHGHAARAGSPPSPEYEAWHSMQQRCYNPNVRGFENYGGRGITVCERWRDSFGNFLADMGMRPSDEHSIDRKDNERGYGPDNCRWSTAKEQANNRRPPKPRRPRQSA